MLFLRPLCNKAIEAITRPPRANYQLDDLGPSKFRIEDKIFDRIDFVIPSQNNSYNIHGSLFRRQEQEVFLEQDCVVYLHGNIGSRISGVQMIESVLRQDMSLVIFDFGGCGMSTGAYVTVGYNEKEDIKCVLDHVQRELQVARIILWGRSMGAVAAVYYQTKYPNPAIKGMVLDSPYRDFTLMCEELVDRSPVPNFIAKSVIQAIQEPITERIGFNPFGLYPINYISDVQVPTFFITSEQDEIVDKSHVKQYFKRSGAIFKTIQTLKGGHNNKRSSETVDLVLTWMQSHMQINIVEEDQEIQAETLAGTREIQNSQRKQFKLLTDTMDSLQQQTRPKPQL